jgi:predicted nucleotidyltransferase
MGVPIERQVDEERLRLYFAGQTDVVAAYLYGSQATGRAQSGSDVDVAILLCDTEEPEATGERRLQLTVELEQACGRPVDVIVLNQAPPVLQHQALSRGKLLFERDRMARIRFEVRARQAYFDLKPMYDRHTRDLLDRIKKGGLGERRRRHRESSQAPGGMPG